MALIQCFREKIDAHELWITSNVQAEIGSPRAFLYDTDANWPEIDTNSKIYPLRGSLIGYDCTHIGEVGGVRGKNCMKFVIASAKGACWKTTFGDWKCDEDGNMNPSTADEPPPAPVY
ncbi:MAG TPA: hypothetical protein VMU71_03185 [Terracidiphilus sp.]|nr:hypothetical protein [Terracidiphilus sp.]